MRLLLVLSVLTALTACGDDEEAAEAEASVETAQESTPDQEATPAASVDLQAVVDTKLYGFRKVPDRTKVVGRVAVGTFISAKKTKLGSHTLLEVTVSPCAGCTPTSEEKTWELKAKHLVAAKKKIDDSAIFEVEKVTWKKTKGMGFYSFLFDARKRARVKVYKAEHAYGARFTDGQSLVEVKAFPCDEKGHPYAKSREVLLKSATKKALKKTVRHAWMKLVKHFPGIGS